VFCRACVDWVYDVAEWTGETVERAAARLYEFPAACQIHTWGTLFDRVPEHYLYVDQESHRIASRVLDWSSTAEGAYLTRAGQSVLAICKGAQRQLREHLDRLRAARKG
jgi:hypothetical protein